MYSPLKVPCICAPAESSLQVSASFHADGQKANAAGGGWYFCPSACTGFIISNLLIGKCTQTWIEIKFRFWGVLVVLFVCLLTLEDKKEKEVMNYLFLKAI